MGQITGTGFKQRVFKACLNRHKKAGLVALNQQALRADRAIKGRSRTPKWLSVTQLALKRPAPGTGQLGSATSSDPFGPRHSQKRRHVDSVHAHSLALSAMGRASPAQQLQCD